MNPDDADLDGTDFAHPAWWRGNDAGVASVTQILQKAINGEDDGRGVFGYQPLTKLRDDILAMRAALKEIATTPHNAYPETLPAGAGAFTRGYAYGITDGHRCAATMARKALGMPHD